ncbi:MAG: DEAD/DEAH box helicase, partial [Candidatus Kariarchaeaceae archaeon]
MSKFVEHPLIKQNQVQLRIYQQVLYAEAVKSNTIIILPTGLGKTIIMVMLAARFLHKFPSQQVVLLAPTRPLVDQHLDTFQGMLNIDPDEILILSGNTPPAKRNQLWYHAKLIIATPQTLRNDIISGICNLENISLLCLDEVHRAIGDDPYVLSAQQFLLKNPQGRLLGITASPGNEEKLKQIIQNTGITNIQYMDENNPQVKPYTHETEETWLYVDLPVEFKHISDHLKAYTRQNLKILKDQKIIKSSQIIKNPKRDLVNLPKVINRMRNEIEDHEFYDAMSAYGQLMLVSQALEMLETQGLEILNAYLSSKNEEYEKTKRNSLKKFLFNSTILKIKEETHALLNDGVKHPKLEQLKKIVLNELNSNNESRILIFANYKATINFIVKELSQ